MKFEIEALLRYFCKKKKLMKLVLSPAKSLNLEGTIPSVHATQPVFLTDAGKINKVLVKKKPKALKDLMSISESLAELNWQRNQDFHLPFTNDNARPAIFTFNGDVYQGLDIETLEEKHWPYLQKSVRILSGLYGILKPMDLIQAYRLEMGTALKVGAKNNLYEFWKSKLTKYLNEELQEGELFVNLASKEYFSALDKKSLNNKVISPIFKDWKDGKLKIISFFAKKARGTMARYLVTHQIESLEDLLSFKEDGYVYSEEHTKNGSEPVFVR